MRAAERARALAAGDLDALAGDGRADQTRKLSFLKVGPEKDIYNPHALQKPASPYQLMAGTIIAASMVSGLNSDLPGFVIAQVTEHVYDSVSGRYPADPAGIAAARPATTTSSPSARSARSSSGSASSCPTAARW